MKRTIVFDTGPIISLATNNLLWILKPLKKEFNGDFLIPGSVKKELVDRPIKGKRFKFEAMQVMELLNNGVLKLVDDLAVKEEAGKLLELANSIFRAKGRDLKIVHEAEIEAVALDKLRDSAAFVVDERTVRMLIEYPEKLRKKMEKKLHSKIKVNKKNLHEFSKRTRDIDMIRSTELVTIAYEKGLLDRYMPKMPNAKKELLDSVLWGMKLNGCSITRKEINRIVKLETK
ncbi:hypothetical protein GF345_02370 [Candidatus Woesearchaeota archaeon]|nr:hypothetical protein [Candidatus Woesearchaeota archaeon]